MIPVDQLSHHYETDAPYWPCFTFHVGDEHEIVGVLYWDNSPVVLPEDVELDQSPVGWVVHVLADGPNVTPTGCGSPHVAMEAAIEAISARGQVRGVDEQTSRERLLWRPLPNSDEAPAGTGRLV